VKFPFLLYVQPFPRLNKREELNSFSASLGQMDGKKLVSEFWSLIAFFRCPSNKG